MGVMALVRNLRNFDQAGISEAAIESVIAKIRDADQVAKVRLFPYQVWAAYKHAPSDDWKRARGWPQRGMALLATASSSTSRHCVGAGDRAAVRR